MYTVSVNGTQFTGDDFGGVGFDGDDAPRVQVTFPGEDGITEWRCTECGEATQDEPVRDYTVNVDPESLCEASDCVKCEGSGEIDGPECAECAGTGDGAHDWTTEAHSWVNSASIGAEEDSVSVAISVGDPRGAFVMTVTRWPDGSLTLRVPHPADSLPHMKLTERSEGHYDIS
jgi:hypothetical protein